MCVNIGKCFANLLVTIFKFLFQGGTAGFNSLLYAWKWIKRVGDQNVQPTQTRKITPEN